MAQREALRELQARLAERLQQVHGDVRTARWLADDNRTERLVVQQERLAAMLATRRLQLLFVDGCVTHNGIDAKAFKALLAGTWRLDLQAPPGWSAWTEVTYYPDGTFSGFDVRSPIQSSSSMCSSLACREPTSLPLARIAFEVERQIADRSSTDNCGERA